MLIPLYHTYVILWQIYLYAFPVPIMYQVHRIRDGKNFATRKVDGIQKGKIIFTLLASFQVIYILLDLEEFKFLVIISFFFLLDKRQCEWILEV